MVTPFRFLAVTSRPKGKCRSIFLTGGSVRCFLRIDGSSTVLVEVLIFLSSYQYLNIQADRQPCGGDGMNYQLVFCVSGATESFVPSFSGGLLIPWTQRR